MTHTYAARLVHGHTAAASGAVPDDATPERIAARVRANTALVVAWGALAIAVVVYAFDHDSIGAALVAVFAAWQMLVPRRVVARSRHDEREPRPIAFQ